MPLNRKHLSVCILLLIYAAVGFLTFNGFMGNYLLLSFLTAGGICSVFFFSFEHRRPALRDIMPIVVICVAASLGRVIFNFIPQIQPVTAMVIIMGITYGSHAGFLTGSLSALISNMYLGQGPWTPWQMLAWGTVGFLAGILGKRKIGTNPFIYCIFGFLAGFMYSIITDIWTLASIGEALNIYIIITVFAGGLVFNVGHAIGNIIFLLVLFKPVNRMLERMKVKYGVLADE